MFENYKKELDSVKLSADFKSQTVALMLEKSQEITAAPRKNAIKFPVKYIKNIAAACFIFVVILYGGRFINYKFGPVSADNMSAETALPNSDGHRRNPSRAHREKNSNKNDIFDGIESDTEYVIYNTDDTRAVEKSDNNKNKKINLTIDTSGGMGFEAYIMKNPGQLEQNPNYTVGDEFDSLPVYKSTVPDARALTKDISDILEKMECSYGPFVYKWYYPVYDREGHHMTNDSLTTDSPVPPGDEYFIYDIKTEITDKYGNKGTANSSAGRGFLRINLDGYVSDSDKTEDIFKAVSQRYPGLVTKNTSLISTYDYNIYGEINYNTYMYEGYGDYGVNIYNSTLARTNISQYEGSDGKHTLISFYLPSYWQKEDSLPAIDYSEALGLLYDGVYYSSCFDEITEDTEVSHIELVYNQGYYNMPFARYECYTLPFYKFYVDITDTSGFNYEDDSLRTYAAYYVCAIHPDYIDIGPDSGYAAFN